MFSFHANKNKGFTMVESMVALVIMSFGMIALVKFQVGMVGYGGLVKAKTAATTLAQQKIENLRNRVLVNDTSLDDTVTSPASSNLCGAGYAYDDVNGGGVSNAPIATNPDKITLVNTDYIRCYKITTVAATSTQPEFKNVTAKLVWNDTANVQQAVQLDSKIAWNDPGDSAFVATTSTSSSTLATPSGGAVLGGTNDYSGGIPGGATSNGDGTSTYQPGDGTTEIISDSTGEVLLTVLSGYTLSTISGNVYVDGTNSTAQTTAYASYPVISDAGYCTRTIASPMQQVTGLYSYYQYQCYVGSSWYGNVGIVRTDNPNSNARVCLGDPSASDTVLSTIRTYRGYETRNDASNNLIVDGNGDAIYFPVGITGGAALGAHHFLITNITGNPSDSDCVTEMSTSEFAGNPDDFYCMSGTCPGTASSATLTVTGAYTVGMVGSIQVTNGGLCSIASGSYSCDVTYVAGTSWSGSITVNPATGYEVCSTNPLTFTGLAADSANNDVTLAATGACAGGASSYQVDGFVTIGSGNPAPKTTSLSGLTVTVSPSASASCTYSYTNGDLSGEIDCDVPAGFSGTITLGGYDFRDTANVLDYSSSAVNADLTNQNITIAR